MSKTAPTLEDLEIVPTENLFVATHPALGPKYDPNKSLGPENMESNRGGIVLTRGCGWMYESDWTMAIVKAQARITPTSHDEDVLAAIAAEVVDKRLDERPNRELVRDEYKKRTGLIIHVDTDVLRRVVKKALDLK